MHRDMDITTVSAPLPPLAPGLPLLGNALDLANNLTSFVVEQYKRLGPIFRVRAFNQEMVVLAGPEANVFITQQGADKFSSREIWYAYGKEFGVEDQLQDLDGEPHMRLRKLMKRGYSASTLLANMPLLIDIVQETVDTFPSGQEFAALDLLRLIITRQLGRALTNYAPDKYLADIRTTIKTLLKVRVNQQIPAFFLRLPGYQKAKRRHLQAGRDILALHRTTQRNQPDFIDDLLAAYQTDRYKNLLDNEDQLLYAALGPFVAGLDTAANECAFLLYALLNHPAALQQCIEEADALFAHGVPQSTQLRMHGALHSAMMETLRLYSAAPGVKRVAAKTFEFAGHRVEQGQTVFLATTASHFLPELYQDPYTFDITRYSEPRQEHKQRGAYAPFGLGTHICLGAGAAEVQIVLVLATLLRIVRLEPAQPGAKIRIKVDPTPTLGDRFRVRIAERRHQIATGLQTAIAHNSNA